MKILAAGNHDTFIVEMSEREIICAAGFSYSTEEGWIRQNGGRNPKVGTVVNVLAAYSFHARISEKQKEAKSAAGVLRALAEMLENGLPDVVIPPAAAKSDGGDA